MRYFKVLMTSEILILATYFLSFEFYINLQIAFLSSFFIILGAMYTYRRMINTRVDSDVISEQRDVLDKIEDPYELYEDTAPSQEVDKEKDFKEIVKEEKKKIKTLSLKNMKYGAKGSSSPVRVVPYIFLILGFIALNNNGLLNIAVYLPSLLGGIVVGYISGKEIFS